MKNKLLFLSWGFYAISLPLSMSLTNIALGFALGFTFLKIWKEKSWIDLPWKALFFLLTFFIWTAFSTMISSGTLKGFSVFGKFWNMVPLFILPFAGFSRTQKFDLLKIAAWTAAVLVVLGTIQYYFNLHYFWESWTGGQFIENQRFVGFQSHPLHAAALYGVLALLSLWAALSPMQKEYPWHWNILSVILIFGVLLTGSRSYYLALSAAIFYLLLHKSWKSVFIGTLIFAGTFVVIKNSSSYIAQRVVSIAPSKTDDSGQERIFMWKAALTMIADRPVMGVGYKQWRNHIYDYLSKLPNWKLIDDAVFAHAHNSYLTIAAETGLTGLFLFVCYWGFLLKEFFKEKNSLTHGAAAALILILCAAIFEHNLLTATVNLSTFFILGLAGSKEDNYL